MKLSFVNEEANITTLQATQSFYRRVKDWLITQRDVLTQERLTVEHQLSEWSLDEVRDMLVDDLEQIQEQLAQTADHLTLCSRIIHMLSVRIRALPAINEVSRVDHSGASQDVGDTGMQLLYRSTECTPDILSAREEELLEDLLERYDRRND
jgi:hypothetical protein